MSAAAVLVRPFAEGDAERVSQLLGELDYPSTAEQVRARMARIGADPDYATMVAVMDGVVVGMIGMQRGKAYERDTPFARILALVVDARVRGCGVGARLVEWGVDWARAQGAHAVHLTTNLRRTEAHVFYERVGFQRTGWRFYLSLE